MSSACERLVEDPVSPRLQARYFTAAVPTQAMVCPMYVCGWRSPPLCNSFPNPAHLLFHLPRICGYFGVFAHSCVRTTTLPAQFLPGALSAASSSHGFTVECKSLRNRPKRRSRALFPFFPVSSVFLCGKLAKTGTSLPNISQQGDVWKSRRGARTLTTQNTSKPRSSERLHQPRK